MIGTSKSVWGFDPRTIPGCQLWLDAADQNVMTLSGSTVTQWKDKSGNVKNTTSYAGTPTLNASAINGRQAITLNGSSSFTGSITGSGNTLTVCIVGIQGSGCATDGGLLCFGRPGYSDWQDSGSFTIEEGQLSGSMFSTRASVSTQRTTTGVNTPFIYILIFDGTYANTYTNGTFQSSTSSSGSFAYTEYKIGTRAGNTQNVFWTGFIGEALVYNTALTTSERQQVEGYLAHKWGLVPYYDSTTPLSIPGCQLWLDGADPSGTGTPPANGTILSTWVDKSGNGRNTTATGTGPTYTTNIFNGYSAPVFNGTTMTTPSYLITTDSKLSIFMLCKKTGSRQTGENSNLIGIAAGYQYFYLYIRTSVTNYLEIIYQLTVAELTNYSISDGTTLLMTILTNGLSISGYLGGTSVFNTSVSNNGYSMNNLTSRWNIGEGQFVGPICEIIIFNSTFTNAQRQTIEGYLAKKWGIGSTPTIPSTHPFYSIRPHLRTFQPIDVPGCQLWLDGADKSSMTFSSGSNLSVWKDKSSYGNNFSLTSGTTSNINDGGYSVVNFPSGAIMSSANQITFTTSSAFFIVSKLTALSASTISMVVGFTNINEGDLTFVRYNPSAILNGTAATTTSERDIGNNNYYVNGTFNPSTFGSNYYLNTYSIIGTVLPSTGGTSYLTLSSAFMSRYFIGNISEFLYYPTGLTSSQRQQIEGYLAHKWGLSLSIPSTHPFKSFPPASLPFSPRNISGLALWLDAADQSSMTLSGSSVTQWRDKSGNGYIMTNNGGTTTVATASLNSLTTVYTPSGTNSKITNFVGRTKCTMFLVGKAASSRYLLALNGGFLYTANDSLLYFSPPTGNYLDLVDSVSGSIVSNNTWFILCIGYDNATNSTANPYTINGTTRSTTITPRGTPDILTDQNITSTLYINSTNGTNSYDSVYTAEILYYNDTLTTSQRQQVEGYLAQKWGLTTSLPATHPYKKLPA